MDWHLPGFGPDTRISTTLGDVPAALLRRGDEVLLPSGLTTAIEWIDQIGLDPDFLDTHAAARPRVIAAGSLGDGLPRRDLVLSGAQQVLRGATAAATPAMGLSAEAAWPGSGFRYTMFHCGRPVHVRAEGVWCRAERLPGKYGHRRA